MSKFKACVCDCNNCILACLGHIFVRYALTLSHSSKMSLSLGRWTTHWISCSTRAVTIWMYIGSPSLSELFSLRHKRARDTWLWLSHLYMENLLLCHGIYFSTQPDSSGGN